MKFREWSDELKASSILVVDDTPDNLRFVAGILAEVGCRKVRLSPSGKHALAAIDKGIPDLVLLDVNMPEMDGYEVCRQLKDNEKTRDVAVIFLTGLDGDDAELKGFEFGAVDFITKPINTQKLLARSKTHLELAVAKKKLLGQNQELIQAAKLREEVERMMQHDLKSPLNIILGYGVELQDELALDEDTAESMESIVNAAYKMLDMIDNFLDLYKIEQGVYQIKATEFNVIPSIRRICIGVNQKFHAKDLVFIFHLNGDVFGEGATCMLWGEEVLIDSMLGNLIGNAVEAAPGGSTVTVSVTESEDTTKLEIHNMGTVPEAIREKFFEKFATSGKKGGTGIGTYSASLIAKLHGGDIAMKTSEDDGTSITISLPSKQV